MLGMDKQQETTARTDFGIPSTLRRCGLEEGLTQAQAARRVGVTQATFSYWESGNRVPSTPHLLRLVEASLLDLNTVSHREDSLS